MACPGWVSHQQRSLDGVVPIFMLGTIPDRNTPHCSAEHAAEFRREQTGCPALLNASPKRRFQMSVKGHIKEAAGFAKEETYEHGKSAKSQIKAQEGRNLRNEGRVEDGKPVKTSKPGTQH
jgi:hypothetical protein